LESRLVPKAGYPLSVVPRVPLPRRLTLDLVRLPGRLREAVSAAERAVRESGADVVVGFGGYVATPAYLAARRLGVPIVVHEQNARPGIANRLGARMTPHVAVTFPGTSLRGARVVGMPLRERITRLDRVAQRVAARSALGLEAGRTTLLVTGGSLGAQRLNETFGAAAADLLAAGVQVLHAAGRGKTVSLASLSDERSHRPKYVVREYLDQMEFAYAAADAVVCRAGSGTVCELTTVGLPAVYVPLPIGNAEQRLNALPVVQAGGGLGRQRHCTPAWPARAGAVAVRPGPTGPIPVAARFGIRDADEQPDSVCSARYQRAKGANNHEA
jgi:UDP-N-acetylglucosamine--N-acetylmuramyl-(pentapeptide) pyrophosphoryl-undecaprenol N-acetylglucosamine transferase